MEPKYNVLITIITIIVILTLAILMIYKIKYRKNIFTGGRFSTLNVFQIDKNIEGNPPQKAIIEETIPIIISTEIISICRKISVNGCQEIKISSSENIHNLFKILGDVCFAFAQKTVYPNVEYDFDYYSVEGNTPEKLDALIPYLTKDIKDSNIFTSFALGQGIPKTFDQIVRTKYSNWNLLTFDVYNDILLLTNSLHTLNMHRQIHRPEINAPLLPSLGDFDPYYSSFVNAGPSWILALSEVYIIMKKLFPTAFIVSDTRLRNSGTYNGIMRYKLVFIFPIIPSVHNKLKDIFTYDDITKEYSFIVKLSMTTNNILLDSIGRNDAKILYLKKKFIFDFIRNNTQYGFINIILNSYDMPRYSQLQTGKLNPKYGFTPEWHIIPEYKEIDTYNKDHYVGIFKSPQDYYIFALEWIASIFNILCKLHNADIVFLDWKTENMMWNPKGNYIFKEIPNMKGGFVLSDTDYGQVKWDDALKQWKTKPITIQFGTTYLFNGDFMYHDTNIMDDNHVNLKNTDIVHALWLIGNIINMFIENSFFLGLSQEKFSISQFSKDKNGRPDIWSRSLKYLYNNVCNMSNINIAYNPKNITLYEVRDYIIEAISRGKSSIPHDKVFDDFNVWIHELLPGTNPTSTSSNITPSTSLTPVLTPLPAPAPLPAQVFIPPPKKIFPAPIISYKFQGGDLNYFYNLRYPLLKQEYLLSIENENEYETHIKNKLNSMPLNSKPGLNI